MINKNLHRDSFGKELFILKLIVKSRTPSANLTKLDSYLGSWDETHNPDNITNQTQIWNCYTSNLWYFTRITFRIKRNYYGATFWLVLGSLGHMGPKFIDTKLISGYFYGNCDHISLIYSMFKRFSSYSHISDNIIWNTKPYIFRQYI